TPSPSTSLLSLHDALPIYIHREQIISTFALEWSRRTHSTQINSTIAIDWSRYMRRDVLFKASPSGKQNHEGVVNMCYTAFITAIFPSRISLFTVFHYVFFSSFPTN